MNHLENKKLLKIRTITSFLTLTKDKSTWQNKIQEASEFGQDLASEFQKNNYEVQSIRIVTNAFGEYLDTSSIETTKLHMKYLQNLIQKNNTNNLRIRFAIGEAKTINEIEMVPELIKEFGDICNICVNIKEDELGIVNYDLTQSCAKVVKEISNITKNSQGNFNFTINYNCKSLIPYFPASYHNSKDEDCFALGFESSDLLFESLNSLKKEENHNIHMRNSYNIMSKSLQFHTNNILKIINEFKHPNKTKFVGIDSSAAPSKTCSSIVEIYKLLNVPYFGAAGTLEASGLLTKVFKSIKGCDLIGFSGLMLAVVEDLGLSQATHDKQFDIRTLLHYSSVCGIGLDTVPIQGDTSIQKITQICQDTGTLAFRLNKPLTVRLFPIKDAKAGDITNFEGVDLCNSTILSVP